MYLPGDANYQQHQEKPMHTRRQHSSGQIIPLQGKTH
jgi:hypothetical protein